MERRGSDFFDETMRLARVVDLMNKDRIQREFEHKVVADTPQLVEKKVNELIDWLVSADLNQWQAVMQHINERKQTHEDEMIGEVGANFRYDRDRLIDSVGRSAQRVVDTYDKRLESEQIAESARMAVAASAVMEAGALGLGALITALATTVAADVTGLIAASVVAALGLFIIPARRRAAQKEMADKIAVLRKHLVEALSAQFERELERSVQQINEAIAPYTRFVRAERTKLEQTKENLIQAGQTQGKLRAEIEAM
jgi:hypothetical protein